ncbi:hypothetical protein CASFOL_015606 [Castilleja foliolosa]|uniref:RING-type domain-containing protein n=1 Tax=Castilleja foliolosa TaxID=1961234 RepID=A0ABD3DER8_9LAMI
MNDPPPSRVPNYLYQPHLMISAPFFLPHQLIALGREKKEGKDCTVCLDSLIGCRKIVTLGCRHVFHPDCIAEWLSQANNNTCPVCRAVVSTFTHHEIDS